MVEVAQRVTRERATIHKQREDRGRVSFCADQRPSHLSVLSSPRDPTSRTTTKSCSVPQVQIVQLKPATARMRPGPKSSSSDEAAVQALSLASSRSNWSTFSATTTAVPLSLFLLNPHLNPQPAAISSSAPRRPVCSTSTPAHLVPPPPLLPPPLACPATPCISMSTLQTRTQMLRTTTTFTTSSQSRTTSAPGTTPARRLLLPLCQSSPNSCRPDLTFDTSEAQNPTNSAPPSFPA